MPPSDELTEAQLAAQHWKHWWLRAQKDLAAAALRADLEYHKRMVMLNRIAERVAPLDMKLAQEIRAMKGD